MPKALGTARRVKCGEAAPERRLLAGRAKDRANTILTVEDEKPETDCRRKDCSEPQDKELGRRSGKRIVVMCRSSSRACGSAVHNQFPARH